MIKEKLFWAWVMSLLFVPAVLNAQPDATTSATVVSFLIEGEVLNGHAGSTVALIENFADAGFKHAETKAEAKGDKVTFTLAGNVPAPGLYFIGISTDGKVNVSPQPVLLQRGAAFMKVKLKGAETGEIQFEDSQLNQQYQQVFAAQKQAADTFSRNYTDPNNTEERRAQISEAYQAVQRNVLLPFTQQAGMVGTATRLMLMNELPKDAAHAEEAARRYWQGINLTDGALGYYPMLYTRTAYFANALLDKLGLDAIQTQNLLDNLVAQAPIGSRTELALLMGCAAGVQAHSPALFVHFATTLTQRHPTQPRAKSLADALVQAQAELASPIAIGKKAPDISLPDATGALRKLTDLKGKYVLIDFWASWCGPCRMENPNVKKAYAEFAPKGFEILGVSIDENKDAWLKAIQADGITWPQVLSPGWQSATAKQYGVQAIPNTLLIDKQGTIIARNLRGQQLTSRLKKLLP